MEGDALELFVENNSLILKKYDNSDEISQNCANWIRQHQRQIISVKSSNLLLRKKVGFEVEGI